MSRVPRLISVARARQFDVTVVTDRVSRELNVAQIIRSADAFGVQRVLAAVPTGRFARTFLTASTGSAHWVDLHAIRSPEDVLVDARARGQKIVATCFSDRARPIDAVDLTQPVSLVFGAELDGVSTTILEAADEHVTIPMCGMTQSLNVSVAAGVVLSEMHRQRCATGLVPSDQERAGSPDDGCSTLSDSTDVRSLVFRWLYPDLCDRALAVGLDAPAVDGDGLIIDRSAWFDELHMREHTSSQGCAPN